MVGAGGRCGGIGGPVVGWCCPPSHRPPGAVAGGADRGAGAGGRGPRGAGTLTLSAGTPARCSERVPRAGVPGTRPRSRRAQPPPIHHPGTMSRTTQRDDLSVHRHGEHGENAESPQQIPAKGWFAVSKRAWAEAKDDQVPLLAAGVAFKAFLAIFPALTAAFLVWSLFGDPQTITNQINGISAIPDAARNLVIDQVETLAGQKSSRRDHRRRRGPAGAVERLERGPEPHGGDQHRLRRGGDARFRQAQGHRLAADPRRHRLHAAGHRASSPSRPSW